MQRTRLTSPDDWIETIFAAKAARSGGVVRRAVGWIEREVGRERFLSEVRARGYHALECGGQIVVVCSPAPIRMIC